MAQLLSRESSARNTGDVRFNDFLSWVLKRIKLPEHPQVLEFGCGQGETTRVMADRLGPRGQIIAVDYRPSAIRLARASTKPPRYARVEFRSIDSLEWPFNDAEFDFAFSARALMYADRPSLVLTEIERVLKPHGKFLAVEQDLGSYSLAQLNSMNRDARTRLNPYVARELPALCLAANLEPTELFPNYVVSRDLLTREALEQQGLAVHTLRPHLRDLGRVDLNDYLRETERAVSSQAGGQYITLMEIGVVARKS